jgi:hypothetical protein
MKLYSLLGGFDYEGDELFGVFASRADLQAFVTANKFACDYMGFIESNLGEGIANKELEFIEFNRNY